MSSETGPQPPAPPPLEKRRPAREPKAMPDAAPQARPVQKRRPDAAVKPAEPTKATLGALNLAKAKAPAKPPRPKRGRAAAAPPRKPPADPRWSATRPMLIGMIGVIGLVLGFGVWGSTASISGAVVAPGRVEVEAKRQVIQHPDGGVVGEILVKDGDLVEAGDVLLRLDDKLLRSELNIIEGQLFELLARGARLRAERDGKTEITFDKELTDLAATRPDVQDYIDGQKRLFAARRETRERETAQLRERQVQIEKQVEGIIAQQKAMTSQLELIDKELIDQQSLLDKQLAQASRVLALQREKARLQGQVGELTAQEAQARGRIAEIEIQILKIGTDMREEAITTLRDLEFREVELRQRRLSTLEKLSRLEIRSPVKGKIYGNTVFAIRSVVRPAEPIMYIVPVESQLVISTRVEPIHIDEVHVGQEAVLRFSAFNSRYTPEIKGKVVQVSADAFVDEARGYSYYTAEVEPEPGEMEKLADRELLPGMPVEAFIQTGERSALNYIIRPMMDYFNKAMREE